MPRPLPDVAASRPVPRQGAIAELEAWHRLVICGRPEQVSVARAFIRQVLGVGHPGIERATLLTSELVTNSVNHSESRLEGGTITVTVRTAGGRVRVEVQDDGGQTAPTLRSDDDLAEAGRGLRLVDAYSLTWDYHQVGTRMITWFECVSEPLALGPFGIKGFNGLLRSGPVPTGCGRRRHGPCGGRCAHRSSRAGPG